MMRINRLPVTDKTSRVWQASAARFIRNKTAVAGLVIIGLFSTVAIFAPFIAPCDPYAANLPQRLAPPTWDHPLGRDEIGRDVLTRLIFGARTSLTIGILSVAVGLFIGAPLGAISGYYGGKIDLFIQRLIDVLITFPAILLALMIIAVLGPSLWNAMIAIGIVSIPVYARLVRGSVLAIREEEYVQAARATGASGARIILCHVFPNTLAPLIVLSSLRIATAILAAAGLGFLGLGAQPPTPEWGMMLSRGRGFIRVAYHVTLFPGLAIFLAVLGFNLLGDGLRDVLDPMLKNR